MHACTISKNGLLNVLMKICTVYQKLTSGGRVTSYIFLLLLLLCRVVFLFSKKTKSNNNNKKGSVSLCTTNNIDKWLSNTSLSDLKRNVFVEKGDTTLTCDVNSCIGKIQQDSSNIINFNKDNNLKEKKSKKLE